MFLNTKLQSRDKPIKVAFIGCGKFVSMFLAQYNQLQKIIIDTIVDINIDNAKNKIKKENR
jgi:homoserine dehydrogenase